MENYTITQLDRLPRAVQESLYASSPDFLDLVHDLDQIEKCHNLFPPKDARRLVDAYITSTVNWAVAQAAKGRSVF